MSRCGCDAGACACVLEAGSGVTITGAGSQLSPYTISATGGGGGGGPIFETLGGFFIAGVNLYNAGYAFNGTTGDFSIAPVTSVPYAVTAGQAVVVFFQNVVVENAGIWTLQWDTVVSNQSGTEMLHVLVTAASPGVGSVPTPPSVDWTVVSQIGTDLSLVDLSGEATIRTAAGGVFSVQHYLAAQAA